MRNSARSSPARGGNASTANCKLQTAYDYKQGELTFLADTAGTVPDNGYTKHLPALVNKRDLLLIDQGYFKLTTFNAIMAKGAFFVTRLFIGTTLEDAQTQERMALDTVLGHTPGPVYERPVRMGLGQHQTRACRLVCLRVTAQVANARRRRFKAHARRQGRTGSQRHLALCDWTLLITNVPETWLPVDMVRALYTLRWQIELLFKTIEIHSPRASVGHRQCPSLAMRALRQIDCGRVGAAPPCGRQHRAMECRTPRDQSGEVIQTAPRTRIPTRAIRDGVVDSSPGLSVQRAGEDPAALSKTSATLTDDHVGNARSRRRSSPPHGARQRLSLTAMGFVPADEPLLFQQK